MTTKVKQQLDLVEGLRPAATQEWASRLKTTQKIVATVEDAGELGISILNGCSGNTAGATILKNMKQQMAFYSRCADLEKQFKAVTLDREALRTVKDTDGRSLSVQLIFRASLPAKLVSEVIKDGHRFKAKTPSPPKEAMEAIEQHGKLFDGLEIWWVPKDIIVEKIPDPDPILIGRVGNFDRDDERAMGYSAYFELHRWIDNSVEEGWWSKEAY